MTAANGPLADDKALNAKDDNTRPASPLASSAKELEGAHNTDDGTTETKDAEPVYLRSLKLWLVAFALCVAIFLLTLASSKPLKNGSLRMDGTVIATAAPVVTKEFNSFGDVGWYSSVYFMTMCISQLLYGKLNARYPIQWSYGVAMLLFLVGSAVCGAAPNSIALIIGRAIAGLGSSGILVGAFSLIPYLIEPVKRPMFTGLIGGTLGIGTAVGPLIGGALTDNVSWRWNFYINLPIGVVSYAIFVLFVHPPKRPTESAASWAQFFKNLDLLGLLALTPSVVCVILALQWGGTTYAWSSGRIIALLVLFGVLAVAFLLIEIWEGDDAMLPARVFAQRSTIFAVLFSFCTSGASFLLIYYIPIWFQEVEGVTAFQSGVNTLPLVIATAVFSLAGGILITVIGYYSPFMVLSSILSGVGVGLLTTFTPSISSDKWIGYQVLYGLGLGLSRQTPLICIQTVLAIHDIPIGSGMVMFAQTLAGAIFISVAQSIFGNRLVENLSQLDIPAVDPSDVLSNGIGRMGDDLSDSDLHEIRQAFSDAMTYSWRVPLALTCISIIGAVFVEHRRIRGKEKKGQEEKKLKSSEAA